MVGRWDTRDAGPPGLGAGQLMIRARRNRITVRGDEVSMDASDRGLVVEVLRKHRHLMTIAVRQRA